MSNFDDTYDEGYAIAVERSVDEIRDEALKLVQKMYPDIQYVVDRHSVDDYSERIWDYPGKWYLAFKLPDGFRNKEELIRAIAEETIRYFTKKSKADPAEVEDKL